MLFIFIYKVCHLSYLLLIITYCLIGYIYICINTKRVANLYILLKQFVFVISFRSIVIAVIINNLFFIIKIYLNIYFSISNWILYKFYFKNYTISLEEERKWRIRMESHYTSHTYVWQQIVHRRSAFESRAFARVSWLRRIPEARRNGSTRMNKWTSYIRAALRHICAWFAAREVRVTVSVSSIRRVSWFVENVRSFLAICRRWSFRQRAIIECGIARGSGAAIVRIRGFAGKLWPWPRPAEGTNMRGAPDPAIAPVCAG